MAYGDLKVRNLIWNTGSGDNTVVLSTLLTSSSPNWTGTATGVNLTLSGDLTVNGTTTTINTTTLQVEDKNIEIGKVSSPSDTTADGGGWTLLGATTKTFNWVNATDAWTSSEHIHLGDNKKLLLGTGSDLQIYHSSTNSVILDNGTGNLKLYSNGTGVDIQKSDGENMAKFITNGAVELYYDNSKKLQTDAAGVIVYGNLYQVDGDKIMLGNLSDLQIYHNGSHNYIDVVGTGNLYIRPKSNFYLQNYTTGDVSIAAIPDGAVELYYDNSKKFETTSGGATITGTLTTTSGINAGNNISLNDSHKVKFGNGDDLELFHDGSHSEIKNSTGNLHIRCAGGAYIQNAAGTENRLKTYENGSVELYYDNAKKFETTSGGINVTGGIQVNGAALSSAPQITANADGSISANDAVLILSLIHI